MDTLSLFCFIQYDSDEDAHTVVSLGPYIGVYCRCAVCYGSETDKPLTPKISRLWTNFSTGSGNSNLNDSMQRTLA